MDGHLHVSPAYRENSIRSSHADGMGDRALAYLYAKKALDASLTDDGDLPQRESVEALMKVVEFLNVSYEGGDMELGKLLPRLHYRT